MSVTRTSSASTFDRLLRQEMQKLEDKQNDNYFYYRCMECVHPKLRPKQICVKCGFCGREFDDEGLLKNGDEYPSLMIGE